MTIIEFPATLADLTAVDYVTQKHECTSLDEFDPVECVPCAECNHAECRHQMTWMPAPIDTTEMTPARAIEACRVEAVALHAAMTATPCQVDGCDCTRMKAGDECTECSGEGCVEDPRTERPYECNGCAGTGVVA